MSGNPHLPNGFYANVLRQAFPESHTYKVALYENVQEFANYSRSGECSGEGYKVGGVDLTGYRLIDCGAYARLAFDTVYDWFNVTVKTRCAVVYDADTGVVLNIMDFGRDCGVINGIFSVKLHEDGVVQLGMGDEDDLA